MISWSDFNRLPLSKKISVLYEKGTFVMSIRYYEYKINLYLLEDCYLEVFVNHKHACVSKITELVKGNHPRMKFYSDQIKLPCDIFEA